MKNSDTSPSQARRIFDRFGGVSKLRAALAAAGVDRDVSALYRWDYPPEKGGTGGWIPSRDIADVLWAARREGVLLEQDDLMPPELLQPGRDHPQLPELSVTTVDVELSVIDVGLRDHVFGVSPFGGWPNFFDLLHQDEEIARVLANALSGRSPAVRIVEEIAPRLTQLRQWWALQKVPEVARRVGRELSENKYEKIILLADEREAVAPTAAALGEFGPVTMYKAGPKAHRRSARAEFQEDATCRVLCAQVGALDASVSLTAAQEVFFVDAAWVAKENARAVLRVHRVGQANPVRVRFAAAENTPDARIQRALAAELRRLCRTE